MTTIDHRILIPANPQVVWDYISNLSRNPKWQVDCRSVTFLTQKHDGPGTRWRSTTESGREHVLEVTAWYNGLGYEYVYIDGPSYDENIGRVRLQEIPEGTIVQWTFTYELPGLLGGLRNSIGTRRQIDKSIADSLRKLYLQIKAVGGGTLIQPKSLIRDAPDVEARSQYQPRHPVPTPQGVMPMIDEPPILDDDAQTLQPITPIREPERVAPPIIESRQNVPIINEPPPADDDTRPNPIIKRDTSEIPAGEEPEFLNRLAPTENDFEFSFDPPTKPDLKFSVDPQTEPNFDFSFEPDEVIDPVFVTPPRIVEPLPVPLPLPAPEPPSVPVIDVRKSNEIPPAYQEPTLVHPVADSALVPMSPIVDAESAPKTVSKLPPSPSPSPLPEPEATKLLLPKEQEPPLPISEPPLPISEPLLPVPEPPLPIPEPPLPIPEPPALNPWEEPTISPNATMAQPTSMDTAHISIWDVFGLQRPSETQQMKAVVEAKPEPLMKLDRPDMTPMRMGLRMALRRTRKTIRRIKLPN